MDLQELQAAYKEKSLLDKMDHQNVIKNLSYFENDNVICIVTDLMLFDMKTMLQNFREPLSETYAKNIFR